jgi:hypothetical protein
MIVGDAPLSQREREPPFCMLVVIDRQAGDGLLNRWICVWLGKADAAGQGVVGLGASTVEPSRLA